MHLQKHEMRRLFHFCLLRRMFVNLNLTRTWQNLFSFVSILKLQPTTEEKLSWSSRFIAPHSLDSPFFIVPTRTHTHTIVQSERMRRTENIDDNNNKSRNKTFVVCKCVITDTHFKTTCVFIWLFVHPSTPSSSSFWWWSLD